MNYSNDVWQTVCFCYEVLYSTDADSRCFWANAIFFKQRLKAPVTFLFRCFRQIKRLLIVFTLTNPLAMLRIKSQFRRTVGIRDIIVAPATCDSIISSCVNIAVITAFQDGNSLQIAFHQCQCSSCISAKWKGPSKLKWSYHRALHSIEGCISVETIRHGPYQRSWPDDLEANPTLYQSYVLSAQSSEALVN